MSRTPSPRPFRLSDGLILIVATAAGLALIKFMDEKYGGFFRRLDRVELPVVTWDDWLFDRVNRSVEFGTIVTLMAAPWSIALLGLRLKRPRPPLRRVWCQPGAMACLALVILVLHKLLVLAGQAIVGRMSGISRGEIRFYWEISDSAGEIVLALWCLGCLARRIRPERNWIDRTGRFIGVMMILIFFTRNVAMNWLEVRTLGPETALELPPDPPSVSPFATDPSGPPSNPALPALPPSKPGPR